MFVSGCFCIADSVRWFLSRFNWAPRETRFAALGASLRWARGQLLTRKPFRKAKV